jgi:hypothetical protein
MKRKQNTFLDKGMTNLLVLVCVVYAVVVCYCCFLILNDDVDFGVVASANHAKITLLLE